MARARLGGPRRQEDRQLAEGLAVARPRSRAARQVALDSRELVDAEGGLDVHHVVLEAALDTS